MADEALGFINIFGTEVAEGEVFTGIFKQTQELVDLKKQEITGADGETNLALIWSSQDTLIEGLQSIIGEIDESNQEIEMTDILPTNIPT